MDGPDPAEQGRDGDEGGRDDPGEPGRAGEHEHDLSYLAGRDEEDAVPVGVAVAEEGAGRGGEGRGGEGLRGGGGEAGPLRSRA